MMEPMRTRLAARSMLVRIRTAMETQALAELVRTQSKAGRRGGADKMSLSFLFFYFLEKPCTPMRRAGPWADPQPS